MKNQNTVDLVERYQIVYKPPNKYQNTLKLDFLKNSSLKKRE